MPSSLLFAWVKNVYSLRQSRGKVSGLLSTYQQHVRLQTKVTVDKHPVLPFVFPGFSSPLSTVVFALLSLLLARFTRNPQSLLLRRLKEI